MTHQNLRLGKHWKLLWATLNKTKINNNTVGRYDWFKCPCDPKSHLLFFLRFWPLIFIHRPLTLSVSFGVYDPPLLTFKPDRLDLRGLDPVKVTSKAHQLKISVCERILLYMQSTSLKVWKLKLPRYILILQRTHTICILKLVSLWCHSPLDPALSKT